MCSKLTYKSSIHDFKDVWGPLLNLAQIRKYALRVHSILLDSLAATKTLNTFNDPLQFLVVCAHPRSDNSGAMASVFKAAVEDNLGPSGSSRID